MVFGKRLLPDRWSLDEFRSTLIPLDVDPMGSASHVPAPQVPVASVAATLLAYLLRRSMRHLRSTLFPAESDEVSFTARWLRGPVESGPKVPCLPDPFVMASVKEGQKGHCNRVVSSVPGLQLPIRVLSQQPATTIGDGLRQDLQEDGTKSKINRGLLPLQYAAL